MQFFGNGLPSHSIYDDDRLLGHGGYPDDRLLSHAGAGYGIDRAAVQSFDGNIGLRIPLEKRFPDAQRIVHQGQAFNPDSQLPRQVQRGAGGAKVIQFVRESTKPKAPSEPRPKRAGAPRPRPMCWEAALDRELSLIERPLVLLGQMREGMPRPNVLLEDIARRCFVAHWPQALENDFSSRCFKRLLDCTPWAELTGKQGQVSRRTAWYVKDGCSCTYTYGTARVCAARRQTAQFSRAMEDLADHVFTKLWPWLPRECWPNSANLNLFSDTRQSIGWHADDESLFMGKELDCPIVSVSLGAHREFWVALRRSDDTMQPERRHVIEVDLQHGDVLTMEGLCQKHCVHFVPCYARYPTPSMAAPSEVAFTPGGEDPHPRESVRINVTFRWIRNHKQRCKRWTESCETLFCDLAHNSPFAAPDRPLWQVYSCDWAGGRPVIWRSCEGCDHDAWRGGRNCVRHGDFWLCRRCSRRASEVDNAALADLPTDPAAATERRKLRRERLRAAAVSREAGEAGEESAAMLLAGASAGSTAAEEQPAQHSAVEQLMHSQYSAYEAARSIAAQSHTAERDWHAEDDFRLKDFQQICSVLQQVATNESAPVSYYPDAQSQGATESVPRRDIVYQ